MFHSLAEAEQYAGACKQVDALLIAGPTTSGKSAFAVELAKKIDGIVINTDSMQVYRDLSIITARPRQDEMETIPHWLYGHIDGAVNYSVGHFLKDAETALQQAYNMQKKPVFVGGTGLYFKALLEGLSPVPPISAKVREKIRQWCEGRESPVLHNRLSECDPELAEKLKPNDRLRIMRALEVFEETGQSLLVFQRQKTGGLLEKSTCLKFFLAPEREQIRQRIDERFLNMLKQGALDEIRTLMERRLDPLLPVMRAHGVPGLIDYLSGNCDREAAILRGQADTRRYAKRQMTWARHQMDGWHWVKI